MTRTLKSDMQVWNLARDLGLDPKDDPLAEILRYCISRLHSFLAEFPCETLTDLLEMAAANLDTIFIEIHSDTDLHRIKMEFLQKGEMAFATLEKELKPGVYAITYKRLAAQRGERQFVSIIDCRGEKAWRSYFSKWHELAHLLTLTSQMRLKFCRTHAALNRRDPEEAVMEVIAGEVGFFPQLIKDHATGEISFKNIQDLRDLLCSEASFQASVIGFAKAWPSACLLVDAGLGYKRKQERLLSQNTFNFMEEPAAELRALHVSTNIPARKAGISIHQNMRIPKRSVIFQVFSEQLNELEAEENLSWWESSSGHRLPEQDVFVMARRSGDHVMALITPVE